MELVGARGGRAVAVDDWSDAYYPPEVYVPPPEEIEADALWAEFAAEYADDPPPDLPESELRTGVDMASRGLARAQLSARERAQVQEAGLQAGLEGLARIRRAADVAAYGLTVEAVERGLPVAVGMSTVDWLRRRTPDLSASEASDLAVLAGLAREPWASDLGEAVGSGRVALYRAAMVARTLKRLAVSLIGDEREAYTRIVTDAACRPDLTDKELRVVCAELLERLLDERDPGTREKTAFEQRDCSTGRRIGAGLTRFIIDAPAAAAAQISGILHSQLAAPTPGTTDTGEVEPDLRSPGNRRFDALLAVLGRGLSNPGAPPSKARAEVILTIPVDPVTDQPTGPVVTSLGEHLPARSAALLACQADLTPVWHGPDRVPLDLGQTKRFATPAQWKALLVRDGGCTFPGCTAPPEWTESHHIIWWSRGGPTDITTLALLCGRHHTHVHLHDLTASLIGGTVVWHL